MHDVGTISTSHGSFPYLVMEYIAGETLAVRLGRGRLSPAVLEAGAWQIADALAAAHAHGIVHRDIKHANILIKGSTLKVLDFGLARSPTDEPAKAWPRSSSAR